MDRNPAQCITTFMRRAEVLAQTSTAPMTDLQRQSFLLDQLLGRTETARNQPLGFPISWIMDTSTMRTLQARARAVLPTANPPPAVVARLPAANTPDFAGCIDWAARQAEVPEEKLEDNPLGPHVLDMCRRKLLQEEIDRQAAASSLLEAPTNKAKEDALKDLETDLNNLDQQQSEHQQLQAEADKKPAAKTATSNDDKNRPAKKTKPNDDGDKKRPAKKTKPNDDGNKKMPAKTVQSNDDGNQKMSATKAKSNDDEDKKISTTERQQVNTSQTATLTDENNNWLINNILPWLSDNNITMNDNGTYCSDSTTPHLMQQWLNLTHLSTLAQEDYETRLHRMQTTGTGPPHVDHPVLSPSTNQFMRDTGARMFEGTICAPQGINTHLKRVWEKQLAEGAHCQSPTPPSTSSDDSDSTPPKCNQKRPAIARSKPPTKKPPAKSKRTPPTRTHSASVIFTGPPPNATEAEIHQWVAFWLN